MGLIKKHRSFVDMLRSLSQATDHSQETQVSQGTQPDAFPTNHRSFFRRRNSRVSITPQSSSSSLKSVGAGSAGTPLGSDNGNSDDESMNSSTLNLERHAKDKKSKDKLKKPKRTDSHHSLRRFFKILHPKDHLDHHHGHGFGHGHGHGHSPKPKAELPNLPLSSASSVAQKYNVGKFIGSGASGLVNLISALDDDTKIYALKKFRAKLTNETEHDYITKVKNEFLVGEYLRHQNLIHTIELIRQEQHSTHSPAAPEFFIIMEYCPHDFFTLVMSGLMRKDEIFCYFKQIINGTNYLHASGIAHRDLKLDNCVVDENGILKLIDFGSAFQFRKPTEYLGGTGGDDVLLDEGHKLIFARGIVGSDPYLAPEVFLPVSPMGYDPRLADIWSIAIIFCCMVLKRFPWKMPKDHDMSFKAYCELPKADQPLEDFEQLTMKPKEPSHKTGPDRLLNLLPSASRLLIRGMLTVDTKKRFLMSDVLTSDFYKNIDHCHYYEEGEILPPALVWDPEAHTLAVSEAKGESLPNNGTTAANTTAAENSAEKSVAGTSADAVDAPVDASGDASGAASVDTSVDTSVSTSVNTASSAVATPLPTPAIGTLIKGKSHKHHLVTEEDIERIHAEREKHKHAKEHSAP